MSAARSPLLVPEAVAIVGGFALQRTADLAGERDFGDRIHEQLVALFGDLERVGAFPGGVAFTVIALELLDRLAVLSGESRDDLWRDVVMTLTEREMRRGEEDR